MGWAATVFAVVVLALGCGFYIRGRWRRSPRAYRAMIGVAGVCFAAGALFGAFALHLVTPDRSAVTTGPAVPARANFSGHKVALETTNLPAAMSVRVVSITDGDTVDVQDPQGRVYSVRLAGIDAPEHDQAFGPESTRHLTELIAGKTVNLECGNERSYGRLICKILLLDGEDVCLDQVKTGMAWHYKQYEDEQSPADRAAYAAAECTAMKDHLGLWSDPHPVPAQGFPA